MPKLHKLETLLLMHAAIIDSISPYLFAKLILLTICTPVFVVSISAVTG